MTKEARKDAVFKNLANYATLCHTIALADQLTLTDKKSKIVKGAVPKIMVISMIIYLSLNHF